jgi:alkanesulfonate monooxygenase SsuD/methylene tetrahydromethanopterin reductase-like flavin-dependent oxidoreductase (luciferase family)
VTTSAEATRRGRADGDVYRGVVRRGIHIPNFGPFGTASAVAELAATAELAGWDGVFVWDHVVRHEGDFDLVDPWVALAAAAVATERVLIGPLVTPLPRRRPWNVAKSAVSLDRLCGGRMVLGVGSGTPRGPEFSAFGEETALRRRGDMLDEGLTIVRAAWSGEPVHFAGEHYRVDGIRFLPTPVRAGGIPIWAATESVRGRPVRRAAAVDGVFPFGLSPGDLPALVDAVGRDRVRGGTYQVVVASKGADAPSWEAAGATWWLRVLDWEGTFEQARALVTAGPG